MHRANNAMHRPKEPVKMNNPKLTVSVVIICILALVVSLMYLDFDENSRHAHPLEWQMSHPSIVSNGYIEVSNDQSLLKENRVVVFVNGKWAIPDQIMVPFDFQEAKNKIPASTTYIEWETVCSGVTRYGQQGLTPWPNWDTSKCDFHLLYKVK